MKHPTIDPRSDNLSDWIAYGTKMNNYAAELIQEKKELEAVLTGIKQEMYVFVTPANSAAGMLRNQIIESIESVMRKGDQ